MNALDEFDTTTDELTEACDADSCLDSLEISETERLLDDLLGRHEDDDFLASNHSEFLMGLED